MAADAMAVAAAVPGLGEHWWAELPQHAVLCRLREQAAEAGPEEGRSDLPRDLMFGLGGELFLWDGQRGAFYTLNLRSFGGESGGLGRYQVRRLFPHAAHQPSFPLLP